MATAWEKNLTLIRERGIQAIRLGSSDQLKQNILDQIDLIKEFLEVRSRLGGKAQLRRPRLIHLFGYESRILFQVFGSLEELVRQAFQLGSEESIATTVLTLSRGQALALDHDATPVYQKFLELMQLSLRLAITRPDSDSRYRLLERLCRSQQEFTHFQLEWTHLKKADPINASLPQYGRQTVLAYQHPLKLTLDRGDSRAFSLLFDSFRRLFEELHRDYSFDLRNIERNLDQEGVPEAERAELEKRRERTKLQMEFYSGIFATKRDILFGLGGWATRLYDNGKLSREQFSQAVDKVLPFLGRFEEVTKLYLEACMADLPDQYGWAFWEVEGQVSHGRVVTGWGGGSWLARFYALTSLRLMPSAPNENEIYQVMVERSVSSSTIEALGKTVRELGNAFLEQVAKWNVLLPEVQERPLGEEAERAGIRERLERQSALWERLLVRRQAEEEQRLLGAQITEETIRQFEEEFRKTWKENSPLRMIAHAYGFYEDRTQHEEIPAGIQLFGLNLLERKEWFVEEHEASLRAVAEHLGKGMGESETLAVFRMMAGELEAISVDEPREVLRYLDGFIEDIQEDQLDSYLIITDIGFELGDELYRSVHFDHSVREIERSLLGGGYRGRYKGVPITDIWAPLRERISTVICGHMHNLGRWQQFHVEAVGQDLQLLVETIDEERARRFLRENPRLGRSPDGQEQNERDAILSLQKSVHIQIWQRFIYEVLNRNAALRVDLRKKANGGEAQV